MTVLTPSVRRVQTAAAGGSALVVARLLLEAAVHERSRATDWRPVVRAAIQQVASDCSSPNWDGYGAKPVSLRSKENAQRLVDLLPVDLPEPQAVADPDGHIALWWDFGRDRVLTISVDESEVASYAGIFGRDVRRHGQEPFRDDVARALLDSIREVSSRG